MYVVLKSPQAKRSYKVVRLIYPSIQIVFYSILNYFPYCLLYHMFKKVQIYVLNIVEKNSRETFVPDMIRTYDTGKYIICIQFLQVTNNGSAANVQVYSIYLNRVFENISLFKKVVKVFILTNPTLTLLYVVTFLSLKEMTSCRVHKHNVNFKHLLVSLSDCCLISFFFN